MPLEFKGQFGNKAWRNCQVKTCTKFAGRRAHFMGHDMGELCQKHAKEWAEAWEAALPAVEDA